MPQRKNTRLLLNGCTVSVKDATKAVEFTVTRKAIKHANKAADRCTMANAARYASGHYFEVHRNVVFEQVSPTKALRYQNTESNNQLLWTNDAAAHKLPQFEGFVFRFKPKARTHSLKYLQSEEFKAARRASDKKNRGKTGRRAYSRSQGEILDLRPRATP